MKKLKFMPCILVLASILFFSASNINAQKKELRHVVMFKFKDSSSAADIKAIEDAFASLPKKIKEIKRFEWGVNNSPENLNQGLTHCFLVTFNSEADREIYLPHPAHKEFVTLVGPHVDKVTVLDYWAKK